MLRLSKVNKYYQVGAHSLHVLRDVDFEVTQYVQAVRANLVVLVDLGQPQHRVIARLARCDTGG